MPFCKSCGDRLVKGDLICGGCGHVQDEQPRELDGLCQYSSRRFGRCKAPGTMAMSVKGKDRRFYCPGHYRNIADPQACEEIIVLTHDVRLLKSHIKLRRLSNLKAPTNTRAKARDALSQAVERLAEKASRYKREQRGPWTVTPERERAARPKLGSPKRSKSYT